MSEVESKTISFHGSMWDCRARMLWQQLFDYYREHGGDLNHMDNMLIDFETCKKAFEQQSYNPVTRFVWGCCENHWVTYWYDLAGYTDADKDILVRGSPCDFLVHCELTSDRAVFTVKEVTDNATV